MKIEYLSSDGIQHAEKAALERMRQGFNASKFAEKWQGYAAFMMMDTTYRDREIDLILLTHDRLLIIELKKWNGTLTTTGDHWLLNGNDMGRSAVKVLADKWKILSSKIRERLKPPARSVWIDYRVILCGSADSTALPIDERPFVLSLDYFLKVGTRGEYEKVFGKPHPKAINAAEQSSAFTQFFRGPQFKPATFSYMNFQIDGDATFCHPDGLYKEYRAMKKDDARHQGLLRRWDFSVLAGKADTVDERSRIALREHQVLGYVHEQNEELDSVLLQPLSHPTRDDVDADFCELYRLPTRQSRLTEFVNRFKDDLKPAERLALVKILLAHFADLHDIRVAHRDIGDHSIWLDRPGKVSISGLITAYYPEAGTVGGLRQAVRAGNVALPEDTAGLGEGTPSDGFRKDVYLLGVVSHYLLYLVWPSKAPHVGVFFWERIDSEPFGIEVSNWIRKSLEVVPIDRFADARGMLNALNAVKTDVDSRIGLDMRAFEPFRTDVLPTVIYRLEENIRQGHCHIYRSSVAGQSVIVKVWYQLRPDPKHVEEGHQLLAFLEKARLIKGQSADLVPEVIDYGISDAGTFLVQQCIPGNPLTELISNKRSTKEALQLCRSLLYAIDHLHGLGFEHGDISPDNILYDDGLIRFVDVLDIFPGGARPHNPRYSPVQYESVPLLELDCFAIAKICEELLEPCWADKTLDLSSLADEIRICITRELGVFRLDRIIEAVEELLSPKVITAVKTFTLYLRRAPTPMSVISDNGFYHVGVFPDRKRPDLVNIAVSGVRSQIVIALEAHTLGIRWVNVKEIQHSQFVMSATKAITKFSADLRVMPSGTDRAQELVESLLSIPTIFGAVKTLVSKDPGPTSPLPKQVADLPLKIPNAEAIWRALLHAEEATLPEAEIAGPITWDIATYNRLRIPYSKVGQPLDYDPDDTIEVLREVREEWNRIGELNTRETSGAVIVLDKPNLRGHLEIGEKLKFRSVQDFSSFRRRHELAP
jgi:Nuclease-related domain